MPSDPFARELHLNLLPRIVEQLSELISLALPDGKLVYVNWAYACYFNAPPEQLIGSSLYQLVDEEDREPVRLQIAEVVRNGGVPTILNRNTTQDGVPRWVEWTNVRYGGEDGKGQPLVLSAGRDVTDRVLAEQRAERQTATLRAVIEATPALVMVADRHRVYRMVNHAYERWSGLAREQVVGRSLAEVMGPEEYAANRDLIDRALAGETVSYERDCMGQAGTAGGVLLVSYIPLRLDDGEVDGFVGVAQDVTDHRRETTQLLQLSQRDPLTGLLNRTGFEAALQEASLREGLCALLYIDLDHFKAVNDTHGHAVGDELLRAFAQRLEALVRPSDGVARLGGDEFAIVLGGLPLAAQAEMVADKVVAMAERPFSLAGSRTGPGTLQLKASVSVGLACGAGTQGDVAGLLARADAQLYRAKQAGRGRWMGETGEEAGAQS